MILLLMHLEFDFQFPLFTVSTPSFYNDCIIVICLHMIRMSFTLIKIEKLFIQNCSFDTDLISGKNATLILMLKIVTALVIIIIC